VGTAEKRTLGAGKRAPPSYIAQATNVPYDGLAKVPVRLNAHKHKV
jgi:hypothetical protein